MTYPKEHAPLVHSAYRTLIANGVAPAIAHLGAEILGRDAAGIPRCDRDREIVSQIVLKLNEEPEQSEPQQTASEVEDEAA